jgi:hypothetical protein
VSHVAPIIGLGNVVLGKSLRLDMQSYRLFAQEVQRVSARNLMSPSCQQFLDDLPSELAELLETTCVVVGEFVVV